MADLLIQAPAMGENGLVPVNMLDPKEAAHGSQNVIYEDGAIKPAPGTIALDATTNGIYTSKLPVLHVIPFKEQGDNGLDHLVAVTTTKIFERDMCNNDWQDRSQSGITYASEVDSPVSYVTMAHDDQDIFTNEDDTRSGLEYYHLIVCDGGKSNIQRWAGGTETDFNDLLGGDGYHQGTTHRALQIGQFHNRLLLLNPLEYNQESTAWIKTRYRIRWSEIGKIQQWSGTGSGFYDLLDTGDRNVWSAQLGNQYIIYQNHTIWSLDYIGGTTVFVPNIQMPNLGLLAPHLLVAKNNVHYFVGDDFNVYAYFGGSSKQAIGDKIQKFIKEELSREYRGRSWMAIEPDSKKLWLYFATTGSYPIKGYGMDMKTGAWMVREFSHRYPTGGITSLNAIEPQSYTVGDSYTTALTQISPFDISETALNEDATKRYGDCFMDTTVEANYDFSPRVLTGVLQDYSWHNGGTSFCKEGATIKNDVTRNDILMIEDGSLYNGCRYGTHFYTVSDVSSEVAYIQICGTADSSAAIAVLADTTLDSVCGKFYSGCVASGSICQTYNQAIDDTAINEKLAIGDSSGFVYFFETTEANDAGTPMDRRHLTPVIDLQQPEKWKRWNRLETVADGSKLVIRTRTGSFDTSNTGWTDISYDLTNEHEVYHKYINRSQKRIQIEYLDTTGSNFNIREFKLDYELEENR